MAQLLKLRWQKASDTNGYRIDPREAMPGHAGSIAMRGSILELVNEEAGGCFVVPRNGRSKPFVIEAGKSSVLYDLAKMQPTPDGVLLFANKWGLLDRFNRSRPENEISDFYRVGAELWGYLHLMSAGRWSELEEKTRGRSISAGRLHFGDETTSPHREAKSLREFCFLELFELIDRKIQVFRCPRPGCNGFFTGRRSTRRTCSVQCTKAISKRRRRFRRKNPTIKGELDATRMAEIENIWRAGCDILIVPDLKRAFVSSSETSPPHDAELLELVGTWIRDNGPTEPG